MPMTGAVASQLIHHVILTHGKWGFFEKRSVRNMRMFLLKPNFEGSSSTCWWTLCDVPTSATVVKLRVLSDCVSKLAGLHLPSPMPSGSGEVGGLADSLQELSDREAQVGAIYEQLRGAWESGVWSTVKDTDMAVYIALNKFCCGGAANFIEDSGSLLLKIYYTHEKSVWSSLLDTCERMGSLEKQVEYTLELCDNRTRTLQYKFDVQRSELKAA